MSGVRKPDAAIAQLEHPAGPLRKNGKAGKILPIYLEPIDGNPGCTNTTATITAHIIANHSQNVFEPASNVLKENRIPTEPGIFGFRRREATIERINVPATTARDRPMGIL